MTIRYRLGVVVVIYERLVKRVDIIHRWRKERCLQVKETTTLEMLCRGHDCTDLDPFVTHKADVLETQRQCKSVQKVMERMNSH